MGEAKQEEPKADETKPEEKKEEKTEEKKEEKKEEEKPSPPAPTVLYTDLHCVGCAKKIERCILTCRGVESVEVDMGQNQVTVKGIVDPQVLCTRIRKKTMRDVKVLSPAPEVDATQVNVISTTELHVNMHCEACAQQLRKNILKMRGVQRVETELSSGKVTVTGTMNADRLVEYVYRRTRKQAKIVPQPKPKEEEKKEEGETKAEEKPVEEEKKEEKKEEEEKKETEEKKEEQKQDPEEEKGGVDGIAKEEKPAKEGGNGGGGEAEEKKEGEVVEVIQTAATAEDDMVKRMMYWPPTVYVIERLPPPQLFSDENPNACCIS